VNREPANREIITRVGDIYKWLDEQLAGQKAVCEICGRCCDFKAFDHRLYVTTPEMMFFADKIGSPNITGHFIIAKMACATVIPAEAGIQKLDFNAIPSTKPILTATNGDYEMASKKMTIGRCSYQVDGKCTVYKYRFAGCRIFCCKGDADFQSELTEAAVKKFKALCEKFQIPYRYVDLPTALKELQPIS
jgi:hypothetical protein